MLKEIKKETLLQVLGLHVFPNFRYSSKYFAQIYRAHYGAEGGCAPLHTNMTARKWCKHLVPIVQRVDNIIHRINHYLVDKCWQNKLHYPLDSDLSGG